MVTCQWVLKHAHKQVCVAEPFHRVLYITDCAQCNLCIEIVSHIRQELTFNGNLGLGKFRNGEKTKTGLRSRQVLTYSRGDAREKMGQLVVRRNQGCLALRVKLGATSATKNLSKEARKLALVSWNYVVIRCQDGDTTACQGFVHEA